MGPWAELEEGWEKPLRPPGCDSAGAPQVFRTRSLLCPSEDKLPVCTALPIWLTSSACWAPNEAARLVVMHRDNTGLQLVITTYELRTKESRDGVDIVGKDLASGRTCGPARHHRHVRCSVGRFPAFRPGRVSFPLCECADRAHVSSFEMHALASVQP